MITQLSVFLQNDKGRLAHLTRRLSDAGIDLKDLFVADTSDFGVVRIFCDTPHKAVKVLTDCQYRARLTDVVAVRVPHEVGGLSRLLSYLDEQDVNIEYGYCFSVGNDSAISVLKIDAVDIEDRLQLAGFDIVQASDVYSEDDE